MTGQIDRCEDLGEVVGFMGEVVDKDCLVLRLSLRTELDDRAIEIRMAAETVMQLAAELTRVSTQRN